MGFSPWHKWLNRLARSLRGSSSPRARKHSRRPAVEALEDRLAPATDIWTGLGGTNHNWSNPANWTGGVPHANDDLVFGPGVPTASLINSNDLPNLTPFNSVTISGSGYELDGNTITLGNITGGGYILVNPSSTNNVIGLGVQMGGAPFNRQFFTVGFGADLTLAGSLSGTSGVELTKDGTGLLTLSNDNTGFTGPITVAQGMLRVTNANALGDTRAPTTVEANAQLQVSNVSAPINENLILNGPGTTNDGALINLAGKSTWAGTIELDSDATIGAAAGSINITGPISDLGAGHNLTKEGAAQVIFSHANTYRGLTTVAHGTLTIRDPLALGASGTPQNGTVVNNDLTGPATLQIEDPTGVGFTVQNEQLTLNGPGVGGVGALDNLNGDNAWTGNVILGSPPPYGSNVAIGSEVNAQGAPTNLTVSGVISGQTADPNTNFNLTKVGPGRVIFTNSNTYLGFTTVAAGMLNVRDSQALGPAGKGGGTAVLTNAALELQVDNLPDSVTGTTNTMRFTEPLAIAGRGVKNTGALRSVSGINVWAAGISLAGGAGSSVSAIGVDPDPHPSADNSYFTNDYSLTVTGVITGNRSNDFAKVGTGQLILTAANNYLGDTTIEQGWVTVQNNQALGGRVPGIGDTVQPGTSVLKGAALHLKPLTAGGTLQLPENLILAGQGITHPFGLISQKGALMNLGGNNTASGDIQFNGNVGIGVEQLAPATASELTLTGSTSDYLPGLNIKRDASGDDKEDRFDVDTGSTSGRIIVKYDMYSIPDDMRIYYDGSRIYDTGLISGQGTINIPYGPGSSTIVEIVMNEGGGISGTAWTYQLQIIPDNVPLGGITKYGSKRLAIQGDGTYSGNVDVQEGVVRAQNDTALGIGKGTTTVENGAALELMGGIAPNNGGVQAGIQVWGEHLVLNGTGNTSENGASNPAIAPLTNLSDDNLWRGAVTLQTSVAIDSEPNSRLTLFGPVDDAANTALTGSDVTKVGGGKLVLAGANTFRGTFYVNQGILNVQNSQALGSTAGGTVVANGASLELQGNITIAGESLTIQGQGVGGVPNPAPTRWFEQGPGPVLGAQTPGSQAVSGRVTGVAVDPSDPNVIYLSAAGGGGWKTKNGGKTWLPLFDQYNSSMFSGAIAVAPSDPRVIYLGTGEADNSGDSFYGTGVYKSTDSGKTWTLLTGASGNVLSGKAISRLAVSPNDPNLVYAAVSDLAVNGTTGNVGVWRFNGSTWFNLTNVVSAARSDPTKSNAPHSPGPDDDFRITFPQANAAWSDLVLDAGTGVLYAALGSVYGDPANAVYRCPNPLSGAPVWYIGDGNTDSHQGEYPNPINTTTRAANVNIKLTVVNPAGATPTLNNTTVYAVNADVNGQLIDIQKSTNGGQSWAATTTKPPNYLSQQGWYDSTIIAADPNTVYVGGADSGTGNNYVLRTTDGGATWRDITVDSKGNGPHTDFHAMTLDSNNRLVVGNDGGVWGLDNDGNGNNVWTDLNGNLATLTFNGIDVHPSDPTIAFGGSQDNGTEKFSGNYAWNWVDAGDGGLVHIDPRDPNVVYHVLNGTLQRSRQGGAPGTWSTVFNVSGTLYFPNVVDFINTSRLLLGGNGFASGVYESTNQGDNWVNLNFGQSVSGLAPATYQGTYAPDKDFALVPDRGANTYDPDTIYAVANGSTVYVTKDHGLHWVPRSFGLPAGSIQDIAVDPRNRDTAIVVRNAFGGGKVFMTTDAGRSWSDITSNLPDLPTWKIVIDPRNGNLYVGTDQGVYLSTNNGISWKRFGNGMPLVQVKDMVLNQALDTLAVGSYGRSMFQLWLDDSQANAGALRSLSGSAAWTGPVILTGDTVISAGGTQGLGNGVSAAQLNIIGTISDQTPGANYHLTKIGGGDVILSGTNTYGGVTEVKQGALVVHNPHALGDPSNGTIVDAGTALELQSSVDNEPLFLNGDGIPFNGHNTGALRNLSNFNTYSGPITLNTNATIGADSGSQLTVTGTIGDGANSYNLTKEGTGTLVLAHANTYHGTTFVNQGALRVTDPGALGSTANGTQVLDGAQLQLQGGITVSGESLSLSGTGIFGSGTLLNTGGNNTWQGPLSLDFNPGFSPPTTPAAFVSFGVSNPGDTLTLNTSLTEQLFTGLAKVGPGKLVLARANSYSGTTYVNQGIVAIQDPGALGGTNTKEVQRITLAGLTTGAFTLTFKGQTTGELPYGATAAQVQAALNSLSTIGGVGGNVTVTQTGATYTVTFQGTLADTDQPPMTATGLRGTIVGVSTAADGGIGTLVASGATLQLDLDPQKAGTGQTVVGEFLSLNGGGVNGAGALENVSGNNTWAAPITLQTSSAIGADAGTQLTTNGGIVSAAAVDLGKVGTGTLLFPTANPNLLGQVIVSQGVLDIQDPGALGSTAKGTAVASGATLRLDATKGILVVTGEPLTLSGLGFNGVGALQAVNGASTWQGPITLAADASVGAAGASDNLLLNQTISDAGKKLGVTKLGAGLVTYGGAAGTANTYTGLTQVNSGTLQLSKGATAVAGNLTVGTGSGPGALVSWAAPNQVATTSTLTVNADGVADLNFQTDTVGGLALSSGNVRLTGPASRLTLAGNVTATSALPTGPGTVTGSGTLSLGGATRTFTVVPGAAAFDLVVSAVITGSAGEGLIKAGPGVMELTNTSTYTGPTTVSAGKLLVDGVTGRIGAVSLDGGTLGGTGTVGAITATTNGGTVRPGDSPGILNSGSATFNGATTFSVQINGRTAGNGLGNYSQLDVTGTVNLGGASLAAVLGNGFVPTTNVDTFTVIHSTGPITGQFAQGAAGFFAGLKLHIDYNVFDAATNTYNVVLTRVPADTTTAVTVTPASGVPNTTFTVTATVTPEPGATVGSPQGSVTFHITGPSFDQTYNNVPLNGNTASVSLQGLAVGTYAVVSAVYTSTDTNFNGSQATNLPSFTVAKDATTTSVVTSAPNPSVYGQKVTFTATVTPHTAGPVKPTGTVTFFDGTTSLGTGSVDPATGKASLDYSALAVGGHNITASYGGDGNYLGSDDTGSTALGQQVNKASTGVAVASSNTNSVYGEAVITATVSAVAPGAGTPTGTVTFTVTGGASTITENDPLVKGVATLHQVLDPGSYTITASYAGDSNFNAQTNSNSVSQVVSKAATNVAVSADNNPAAYGQTVTFTATVSAVAPGAGTPTGTVTFFIDGTRQSPDVTLSGGKATFQTSALGVPGSPHSVTVAYNGDTDFSTGGGALAGGETVTKANVNVAVASDHNPSVYGQKVTFTATVSPQYSGTPAGTVAFVIDGVKASSDLTLTNGQATFSTAALDVTGSPHTVTVNFTSTDGNFNGGSGALAGGQAVGQAGTSTSVVPSPTPSTYGQQVTFTATVSVTIPGAGTPTGTVTFYDGSVAAGNVLGAGTLDQTTPDQATFTTSSLQLKGGSHTVIAVYQGDSRFTTSRGSTPQTVNPAATTTSNVTADANPSVYGQTVTFTATVRAGPGLGTPTGTVNFFDGNTPIGSGTVGAGGKATATVSTLAIGNHFITAQYLGDQNFAGSASQSSYQQVVNKDNTATVVTTSNATIVFGQPVTIKATVSAVAPGTGTPTGTVTFTVRNNGQTVATETDNLSGGVAVLQQALAASPNAYTISATYNGDGNFQAGSSGSTTQTVNPADTSAQLGAAPAATVYGQAVTFTATVAAKAPGAGTPDGTVTFSIDGTPQSPVSLTNGQASITTSGLAAGGHTVSVHYNGSGNFNTTDGTLAGGYSVSKADTGTAVAASPSATVYGQAVTFTATVAAKAPGAGTPDGTVTFSIDGAPTTVALTGGQASYTISVLPAGSHTVTATYNGSGNFNTSGGGLANGLTVAKDGTATTLASDNGTQRAGRPVTFTAVVTAAAPGGGTPTGTVTFFVDGSPAQGVALDATGRAVFTTSSLSVGSHSVTAVYGGSGNYNGSGSAAISQAVLSGNQVFVAQAYRDLLHREADPNSLAAWSGALDRGQLTRTQFAQAVENSTEYRADEVQALYQLYLHRAADPNGLNTFVNYLQSGGTVEGVAATLAGSQEYFQSRAGGSVDAFLDDLYLDALHRHVDPQAAQAYKQALAFNASRQQVAASVLSSNEYYLDEVALFFQEFLHRNPDPNGQQAWANAMAHGLPDEAVIANLVGSDEYFNKL